MSDEVKASDDAPEVVQSEVDQTEAPEAAESTEGQVETQPAEGEEPEGEQLEDEKPSPSKARRERRNKVLAEAKAEAERAREEADRYRAEVDRLKGRRKQPPRQEDFKNDYDAYLRAATAYDVAEMMGKDRLEDVEREASEHQRRAEAAQRRQQAEAQQNWVAQAEDAKSRYADFEQVVSAPDVPITKEMAEHIAMSDVGADTAYYLGMNKDQARSIASMSPQEQAGAMRMLENFVSIQTPKPRTQTTAPEPIKPVKPKGTPEMDPESMSVEKFNEMRAKGWSPKL